MNDDQFPTVSNKDSSGRVCVRATCYRSMKKTEKPHDLRVGRKSSVPWFKQCSDSVPGFKQCSFVLHAGSNYLCF